MIDRAVAQTWPALVIALLSVIAGGLLSAVTAHAATQSASWAAAYLVLVGGIGTGGLAIGRGMLSRGEPSRRRLILELAAWIFGNVHVLAGTLGGPPMFVEIGSAFLVGTLISVLLGVWKGPGHRALRGLFLTLVIVLLVSIPVGILLSNLRH